MLKFIMFDLDGTLANSRDDIAMSVNFTLDSFVLPRREPEEIYGFIGGGVHNLIRNSLPEGAKGTVEEGVELFWRIYKEHVLDTTRLYPGIKEALGQLRGVRKGVVTNKPLSHARLILEGLGIADFFETVQGWVEGIEVKPSPQMLYMALDEADVPKEHSVMVGDSMNDLLAARNAGVRACIVGYGYGRMDAVLEAKPEFFAQTVADIPKVLEVA